jgi:hypothetical protein
MHLIVKQTIHGSHFSGYSFDIARLGLARHNQWIGIFNKLLLRMNESWEWGTDIPAWQYAPHAETKSIYLERSPGSK